MKLIASKTACALAAAATLAMTATPAMARGWHGHHRDRGIDTGDVIAGVLIIGGIAAIASAAAKSNRDKREREARYPERRYPSDDDYRDYRDYRDRSGGYGDRRDREPYPGSGWRSAGSMDGAVETCVGEVERADRRVDTVDTVNREGDGWRVEGLVSKGGAFSCTVDRDGRVRRVTVDGQAVI